MNGKSFVECLIRFYFDGRLKLIKNGGEIMLFVIIYNQIIILIRASVVFGKFNRKVIFYSSVSRVLYKFCKGWGFYLYNVSYKYMRY